MGIVTEVAYSSKGMSSTLGSISNDQSTNFIIKVRILPESYADLSTQKEDPFLPGMSATVEVKTDIVRDVIAVPVQAVTTRDKLDSKDQQEVVFIAKDKKAQQVAIQTGIQDDTYIQIIGGLAKDSKIITAPYSILSKTIKDGDKITVVDKDKLKAIEEEEEEK